MQFSHNWCKMNSIFAIINIVDNSILFPWIQFSKNLCKWCRRHLEHYIGGHDEHTPTRARFSTHPSATIKTGQRAEKHVINAGRRRASLTDTMVESLRWCTPLRRMWPLNPLLCRGWRQGRVRETERRAPGETKAADRLGSGSSGALRITVFFFFFLN